ncbi:helix-turn-helix domain-containing protein [Arthrobacter alpinus]|uniref:helix-turn-helix domain-containing protein n=1 Tax=Arthrobacter alpinus TaxID=656366 RepID=UPI0009FB0BC4
MLQDFGYAYLTLARIDHAKRACALVKEGSSLIDAAAIAGYADQPHLSREFQRLVGVSPGQFL